MNKVLEPNASLPVTMTNGEVWPFTLYLKNFISHPNIEIGDFTYYTDFHLTKNEDLAQKLAPYLEPGYSEKLIIGKFVQIAQGTKFITSSANHQMDGFSTYPFSAFVNTLDDSYRPLCPFKGNTIIEHDVWLGYDSIIMPGVKIGSGSIIGTSSVVTKNVPPYHIVAGNPATIIRARFDEKTIDRLLQIAWWDWPINKIMNNIDAITGANLEKLLKAL